MALSCSSRFHCLSRFFQKTVLLSEPFMFLTHKSLFQRPFRRTRATRILLLYIRRKTPDSIFKELLQLLKATPSALAADSMCGTLKTEQRKRPKIELFFE
jgi:hypothetical protein